MFMAAAFAFVFSPDGKLLILREDERERQYMWDLPGGTLTGGEDPLVGMIREVREETGLDVRLLTQTCWLKRDTHVSGSPILVAFYLAGAATTQVTLSPEHTAYRWVTLTEYGDEQLGVSAGNLIVQAAFSRHQELALT